MADTYEKRARERRKQQKRREKLERKHNPDSAPPEETDAREYFLMPGEELDETEE